MGGAIANTKSKAEVHPIERCGQTKGLASNITPGSPELEVANVCGKGVGSGLQKGTSGAPVYKANRAYGIVFGGAGHENCLTLFDGISKVEHVLGVKIVTD